MYCGQLAEVKWHILAVLWGRKSAPSPDESFHLQPVAVGGWGREGPASKELTESCFVLCRLEARLV